MDQKNTKVTQTLSIPCGSSLAITIPNDKIICEVCGAENSNDRQLCRVCSNYLKDEEEF